MGHPIVGLIRTLTKEGSRKEFNLKTFDTEMKQGQLKNREKSQKLLLGTFTCNKGHCYAKLQNSELYHLLASMT